MTEPNNRDNQNNNPTFPYPFYNPYFSYFPIPQFPHYPQPFLNNYAYLKFNDPKNQPDASQPDYADDSDKYPASKIKSQPILLLDDDDLKIKSIQKKQKRPVLNASVISCHCLKSHCLKQYCLCYKSGVACEDGCSCSGCKNTQDDLNQKLKPKTSKRIKCKCSKSQCVKKYCQCYSAKRKCQDLCQCIGCQN